MKINIPRPTKSLMIIILLSMLLMVLSINLWATKAFTVTFYADASKQLGR